MKLVEMVSIIDGFRACVQLPLKLIVSREMWESLRAEYAPKEQAICDVKICGLPIFESRFFKPSWWAEEYADYTVLHHENGSTRIPKPKSLTVDGLGGV